MLAAPLALVATSWGSLVHARLTLHSHVDPHQPQYFPAATGDEADVVAWGQSYPQWGDDGKPEYTYEEEEFFLEDTPRVHRPLTEPRLDSVPFLVSSTAMPDHRYTPLYPYATTSGSDRSGDGCSSFLADQHIRGFTQTEQTSFQVGSGVVRSFSVVTISVAQTRDAAPEARLFLEDDNFTDDFELTLLDEQATTITGRSSVRSLVGFVIAVFIAGAAMLLVGTMLWATYAAAEAIVNGLFVQCDRVPHKGCLGGRRHSAHELDYKTDSVTAPLLKV